MLQAEVTVVRSIAELWHNTYRTIPKERTHVSDKIMRQ